MKNKYDIIWLQSIDSTNDEARRRISTLDNLSVLSAFCQTSGHGQRGNSWYANAGENLTFSIVLKHNTRIKAIDQFALSEMAALAVIELLAAHEIEAKVKWPNDIYVGDRKICGILIENSLRGDTLSSSIIGIGLNVNQTEFDPSLPNPTSMALCNTSGRWQSLPLLLEEFMDIFKGFCNRYLNITGGLAQLRRIYLSHMWHLNETVLFIDYTSLPDGHLNGPVGISSASDIGRKFPGKIRGLSPVGNLLVEDLTVNPSQIREFSFKEIAISLSCH